MENTLGKNSAQGIFIMLRLFKRFDFTRYDLAGFQCRKIAAVSGCKDFCINDGFRSSINGFFFQASFRSRDRIADVFVCAVNKRKL